MLFKLASVASATHGLDYDECLRECYWAFVKAVNWRWDPTKGTKLSTTVYTIAKWRLKNLKRARDMAIPTLELNEEIATAPPLRAESLELIDDLSADAREILDLILETPGEVLGRSPVPVRHLVKRIKEYLSKKGRDQRALESAHRELQECFRTAWAQN